MTAELNTDDDLKSAFAAGVADVAPPPDDQAQNTDAAPSQEGVVTSGAEESSGNVAGQDAPAADKPADGAAAAPAEPKKPLGRLSHDEILAMLPDGEAKRAVEIQFRRHNKPSAERSKTLANMEERGRQVKAGIETLNKDYPDIAKTLAPVNEFVEAAIEPLREAEEQRIAQEAQAHVEKTFPGFVQVISDGQFSAWLQSQPDDMRRAFAQGGTDGAFVVLDAYDTHVTSQGKSSPFVPPATSAPAPAAPDLQAEAARIQKRRELALKSTAAAPTGARGINQDDDVGNPWAQGVNDLRRTQGFR